MAPSRDPLATILLEPANLPIHLPSGMFQENWGPKVKTQKFNEIRNSEKYCYSLAIKFKTQSSPDSARRTALTVLLLSPSLEVLVMKGTGDTDEDMVTTLITLLPSGLILFCSFVCLFVCFWCWDLNVETRVCLACVLI